jgi:hypothetical protein
MKVLTGHCQRCIRLETPSELTGCDNIWTTQLDVLHEVQLLLCSNVVCTTNSSARVHVDRHNNLIECFVTGTIVEVVSWLRGCD